MHDANGKPLAKGDKVLVPAVITELCDGVNDYCNVRIETTLGRRPDSQKERISTINTGVLVKVASEDVPTDCLTDEELCERAEANGVDLIGVKDRAGMIEAIRSSKAAATTTA